MVVQLLEWPVVALLKVMEYQVLELVLDNSTIQRVVKDDTAFLQTNHKRKMSLFLSNTYLAHLDLLVDLVAELQVTRLLHSTITFPSIHQFPVPMMLFYTIFTQETRTSSPSASAFSIVNWMRAFFTRGRSSSGWTILH